MCNTSVKIALPTTFPTLFYTVCQPNQRAVLTIVFSGTHLETC